MAIHAPAAEIAVRTVSDFITRYALPEQVYFVCYDEETARLYARLLHSARRPCLIQTRPSVLLPLCARHPESAAFSRWITEVWTKARRPLPLDRNGGADAGCAVLYLGRRYVRAAALSVLLPAAKREVRRSSAAG